MNGENFRKMANGFTVADLLFCVAAISICGLVALPSIGNNRTHTKATLCLSNQRHLAMAWQLYAAENKDVFVQNYHGGEALGGTAGRSPQKAPWAVGWLDWTTSADNTNTTFIRDPRFARLAPFLQTDRDVHKCPADTFLSSAQTLRGFEKRVRTVALSATIGEGNAETGPWDPSYVRMKKYVDVPLAQGGPGELLLFADEQPDSINDPLLFPPMNGNWADVPGSLHHGAGSLSFVDGHAELHAWRGSLKNAKGQSVQVPNDPDLLWVRNHSGLRR